MTTHSPSSSAGARFQIEVPVEVKVRRGVALVGFGLTVPWMLWTLTHFGARVVAQSMWASDYLELFVTLHALELGLQAMTIGGVHLLARHPTMIGRLRRWLVILAWLTLVACAWDVAMSYFPFRHASWVRSALQLCESALWYAALHACARILDDAGRRGGVHVRRLALVFPACALVGFVGHRLVPFLFWPWFLGSAALLAGSLWAFTRTWRTLS